MTLVVGVDGSLTPVGSKLRLAVAPRKHFYQFRTTAWIEKRPISSESRRTLYYSDAALDQLMSDLLEGIAREADMCNCFFESNVQLEGSDLSW